MKNVKPIFLKLFQSKASLKSVLLFYSLLPCKQRNFARILLFFVVLPPNLYESFFLETKSFFETRGHLRKMRMSFFWQYSNKQGRSLSLRVY